MNNVYKTINYNKLNEILTKENWNEVYNNNNVNECFNVLIGQVDSAISMTTTTKTANSKNKHLKEWMTYGLLCSLRNKQKLSIKVHKHPNNHNYVHITYYIKINLQRF